MQQRAEKSDSAIQGDVQRELRWDQRIEEAAVGVEVRDDIVTLTGTVDSWSARRAAQDAAHRVAGVQDVANEIVVLVPGCSGYTDAEIAKAVRHALHWAVFVPEASIASTVSDGWVTLEGEVETWSERDAADTAIRNLASVRGVTNDIEVVPAHVFPGDVRCAIEAALERRAEREAGRIGIEVHEGTVTLTGLVHSWEEKQAVLGAAKGTLGVRVVDDRLQIGIRLDERAAPLGFGER